MSQQIGVARTALPPDLDGLEPGLSEKYGRLASILEDLGSVLVGYSGGVDSTCLLRTALEVLGRDRVLAVTALSPSFPERDLETAREEAERMGARHRLIRSRELEIPQYRDNPPNRCYFCKHELYTRLRRIADEEGWAAVIDGSNADDQMDYRPGFRAVQEKGVRSPLLEAGLTKAEVRQLSRALGLSTWERPASPCLASRFPYGTVITEKELRMVDRAEEILREEGFAQVRVRHHGDVARIEVPREVFRRILDDGRPDRIVDGLKAQGYRYVTLDLQGYRQGSLNEVLDLRRKGAKGT